jgi:tight adherence protein B
MSLDRLAGGRSAQRRWRRILTTVDRRWPVSPDVGDVSGWAGRQATPADPGDRRPSRAADRSGLRPGMPDLAGAGAGAQVAGDPTGAPPVPVSRPATGDRPRIDGRTVAGGHGREPFPAHRAVPFPVWGSGAGQGLRLRLPAGLGTAVEWLTRSLHHRPRMVGVIVTLVIAAAAALLAPVVAVVAGAYAWFGVARLGRMVGQRTRLAALLAAVDTVAALAADLRAGVQVGPALETAAVTLPQLASADGFRAPPAGHATTVHLSTVEDVYRQVAVRVWTAVGLAQDTGAPMADVLGRLADDLRLADRLHATMTAHAAGARASAWLLAGLPFAGIGLGYGIGADPGRVLLHTPLGAICLLAAAVLHISGLAWSDRITRVEVGA